MYFRCLSRLAAVLWLAVCLWSVAAADPAGPDQVTLTWSRDPRTTQTIAWRTEADVQRGRLRFAEAAESDPQTLFQPSELAADTIRLATGTGMVNRHSVTASGLKPGRRYHYQVGDGESWSRVLSFRTAPAKQAGFKFLIFGDSQSSDYTVWRDTLQQAFRLNPDAAFFVNAGDLVDVGQDYAEWEAWFAAAAGVIDRIPAMPLTGNHETYTPERVFSPPRLFTAQFVLPENGPAGLERQVYSFDYGDVHFVMLDSQEGEQRRFVPDLLERQREWLAADLAASTQTWKIVFLHRPIYGNKPGGVDENLRQVFAPVLDLYGADIVFSAHDHVVARTPPLRSLDGEIRPSGGTVHAATGRSGTKTYNDVAARGWNVFFHNPADEPDYLVVQVSGGRLRVQTFSSGGALIDEWESAKAAGP